MATFKINANDFNGAEIHFGSLRWAAIAVKENGMGRVYFFNKKTKQVIEVEDVNAEDFVWFHAAGSDSKAGKCAIPKNPIKATLWAEGFRRGHMLDSKEIITNWDYVVEEKCGNDGSSYGHNSYGQFVLDFGIGRKAVYDANGILMIGSACGRIQGRNDVLQIAYVSPYATKKHLAVYNNGGGTVEDNGLKNITIETIICKEQNEFHDPRKENNGGGYHQPYELLKIKFNGKTYKFELNDTSCGDFGDRYEKTLYLGDKVIGNYYINQVGRKPQDDGYYGESTFNYSMLIVQALVKAGLIRRCELA